MINIELYAVLQPTVVLSTINIVSTVPGRPEALRDLPAVLNTFTLTFAEKSHRALMRKKAVCLGVGRSGE